jgi:hypothetical protein
VARISLLPAQVEFGCERPMRKRLDRTFKAQIRWRRSVSRISNNDASGLRAPKTSWGMAKALPKPLKIVFVAATIVKEAKMIVQEAKKIFKEEKTVVNVAKGDRQ